MYSMFRNVFGSIGISLSTAFVTERTQADQANISKSMTALYQPYNTYIAQAEQALRNLGRPTAGLHDAAVGQLYQTYMKQASVLAYGNIFLYASVVAFCVIPFCLLISKKTASGGGGGH